MELMIIMVAVLCFLDALWSYAFAVSSKPARASSTSKYTFIKTGPGRSRSLWCCFSSSSNQRKARSLHCSDTGHLCVSLAVLSAPVTQWVAGELQTEVTLQYSDSRPCARSVPVLLEDAAGTASVWQLLYYPSKFQQSFNQ